MFVEVQPILEIAGQSAGLRDTVKVRECINFPVPVIRPRDTLTNVL